MDRPRQRGGLGTVASCYGERTWRCLFPFPWHLPRLWKRRAPPPPAQRDWRSALRTRSSVSSATQPQSLSHSFLPFLKGQAQNTSPVYMADRGSCMPAVGGNSCKGLQTALAQISIDREVSLVSQIFVNDYLVRLCCGRRKRSWRWWSLWRLV